MPVYEPTQARPISHQGALWTFFMAKSVALPHTLSLRLTLRRKLFDCDGRRFSSDGSALHTYNPRPCPLEHGWTGPPLSEDQKGGPNTSLVNIFWNFPNNSKVIERTPVRTISLLGTFGILKRTQSPENVEWFAL